MYEVITTKSQPLSFFLGSLAYSIGVMSDFAEEIVKKLPEFENFAGDFGNLSDVVNLMDQFEQLHSFVQHITPDVALDLHFFVRHLATTVNDEIEKANASTVNLRELKKAFDHKRNSYK